jgi:hypothetical protein
VTSRAVAAAFLVRAETAARFGSLRHVETSVDGCKRRKTHPAVVDHFHAIDPAAASRLRGKVEEILEWRKISERNREQGEAICLALGESLVERQIVTDEAQGVGVAAEFLEIDDFRADPEISARSLEFARWVST